MQQLVAISIQLKGEVRKNDLNRRRESVVSPRQFTVSEVDGYKLLTPPKNSPYRARNDYYLFAIVEKLFTKIDLGLMKKSLWKSILLTKTNHSAK